MNDQQQGDPDGGLPLMRIWSDFASRMIESAAPFSPCAMSPDTAREIRANVLKAWADYLDQSMRSPAFLDTMRQSLGGAVQFRKQFNEMLGEMQHALQGASRQDIDQLAQTIRHLDERLSERLETFSARLDELDTRLQKLLRQAVPPNSSSTVTIPS